MGSHRRIAGALTGLGLGLLLPGCHGRSPAASDAPLVPIPSAAPASPPLDRLAPGELAPGTESAFGLVVPSQMAVTRRFGNAIYAEGRVRPEALTNYLRSRVVSSHIELGAARTVFPQATVKGGDPHQIFRVEVVSAREITELVIRDVTPIPGASGISEEERWRRAGLTRDGQVINLKEMEEGR